MRRPDALDIGTLSDPARDVTLFASVYRTTTPWERLRGLLGRAPLAPGEGLLIDPCGSIHTFLMGYPIDVVYLSRDFVVSKIVPRLGPWRCSMAFGAAMTLELCAGAAEQTGLVTGQALLWRPGSDPAGDT